MIGHRWIMAILLVVLAVLAAVGLRWGVTKALTDSADLERRVEEVSLFLKHADPFTDPDMTYPPSAPPVFSALIGPIPPSWVRPFWVAVNLVSLAIFCGAAVSYWGQDWPRAWQVAFCLAVLASKPVRAGIALGQFHVVPMALIGLALVQASRWWFAGFCLGIALIKPTMIGPLLIVPLLRGQWKLLGMAAAIQAALWFSAAWWLDRGSAILLHEWLENARSQLAQGTIDVPTLLDGRGMDGTRISLIMVAVSGLVLVGLRRSSETHLASLALFLAAIVSYHRHYDMVLLVPAMASMIQFGCQGRRWVGIIAGGFALMLISPAPPTSWGAQAARGYDIIFVVVAYAALMTLFLIIATEGRGDHTKTRGT